MASAVLFVELAAGRLRKLERMAWPSLKAPLRTATMQATS
jgi:hypothetical protein